MDVRVPYELGSLDESSIAPNPFAQFATWLEAAVAVAIREPAAMTLATVSEDHQPSARIVLLRGYDEHGFVFYTNYESRKGHDLATIPKAALLFYWDRLERQVRIEGAVTRLESTASDAYFAKRPRGHRIAAWASRQSEPVANRAFLEAQIAHYEAAFAAEEVQRPPSWGGYRVTPARFEFWQGRPNRVHDRIAYVSQGDTWQIQRLSP